MGSIFANELIHNFLVILLIIMKCGRPEFLQCEPPVAELLGVSISVIFSKKKCVIFSLQTELLHIVKMEHRECKLTRTEQIKQNKSAEGKIR